MFSTWLAKRVGGVVGRRMEGTTDVGGGESLNGVT